MEILTDTLKNPQWAVNYIEITIHPQQKFKNHYNPPVKVLLKNSSVERLCDIELQFPLPGGPNPAPADDAPEHKREQVLWSHGVC